MNGAFLFCDICCFTFPYILKFVKLTLLYGFQTSHIYKAHQYIYLIA